ncbi:MAG: cytochrome c biogenesis protein ResB [Terrimesophilobacter sp.]
MSRPSDHIESPLLPRPDDSITQPKLGLVGYLRFFWRQLTNMRTALFLLLLLAIAAVPGSLVPQRSSDPNGVVQYVRDNPGLAPVLDTMQFFDVYTSVWFSSIYLLLFVSLIGCVVPRTLHHLKALRAKPPKTPARLERLAGFTTQPAPSGTDAAGAVEAARQVLRGAGYRVQLFDGPSLSVSAERGYARETGNLVFHTALIGVLIAVGIGGGFGYAGQKVVVEGQTFVNVLGSYDSFNPGRFFTDAALAPYRLVLKKFTAVYEEKNLDAYGQAIDYRADVTAYRPQQQAQTEAIKVNEPLSISGTNVYLLGNGYAPRITVRDGAGNVAFTDSVPFLPQDTNLTSIGVIKVPDALPKQIGMIGFFYPTAKELSTGAFTSIHPDLRAPMLSLRVYTGDLGLGNGKPKSVYELNTDGLTEVAGSSADTPALKLKPGQTVSLPGGIGTVTFENMDPAATDETRSVSRFASLDIHHDPSQQWVFVFVVLAVAGLLAGLFIPRRRVWVKAVETDGVVSLEYAGLARGEDPGLEVAVADIARRHIKRLTS